MRESRGEQRSVISRRRLTKLKMANSLLRKSLVEAGTEIVHQTLTDRIILSSVVSSLSGGRTQNGGSKLMDL